jgi:hypothetical protein
MTEPAKRSLTITIGIAALALLSGALAAAQENADRPAAAAREELRRLIAKSAPVRDIRATVLSFEEGKPARIPTYRYFWSGDVGFSRLEMVAPQGHTLVFVADERSKRVCAPVGNESVVLDEEGSKMIHSTLKEFSALVDPSTQVAGDLYCVGTETVNDRVCALFLYMQGGVILTKLWIGVDDGILRKKEFLRQAYIFADVKVNTGLTREVFGVDVSSTNLAIVSWDEFIARLRKSDKAD